MESGVIALMLKYNTGIDFIKLFFFYLKKKAWILKCSLYLTALIYKCCILHVVLYTYKNGFRVWTRQPFSSTFQVYFLV